MIRPTRVVRWQVDILSNEGMPDLNWSVALARDPELYTFSSFVNHDLSPFDRYNSTRHPRGFVLGGICEREKIT